MLDRGSANWYARVDRQRNTLASAGWTSLLRPPKIGVPFASTRQPRGTTTSTPPNTVVAANLEVVPRIQVFRLSQVERHTPAEDRG